MKTRTIGETLKEERLRHRLRITDLSKKTRIRPEYLEALEENQFDLLPASTFVKGYIKSYANIFGFDEKPLLAMLRRDFKESAKGKLVPREFIKPLLKKRTTKTSITVVVAILAGIFVSLLGYVGIGFYNLNKPPKLEIYSPKQDDLVASNVVVEGLTLPEAIVTVNEMPVALKPDGEFRAEISLPNEGVAIITVTARDRRGKTNTVERSVRVEF